MGRIPMNDKYKGWYIHWTGWKASPDNDRLVGQWIALKNEKVLFASVPGGEGEHRMYAVFPISPVGDQVLITVNTPLGIADKEYLKGHDRLFKLIDEAEKSG